MEAMGTCIHCGAPIFTSDEPVEGQPCLDCIFEPPGTLTHDDLCRLSRAFNERANLLVPQDYRINEWLKKQIAITSGDVASDN